MIKIFVFIFDEVEVVLEAPVPSRLEHTPDAPD
jgi:hypothetical protein